MGWVLALGSELVQNPAVEGINLKNIQTHIITPLVTTINLCCNYTKILHLVKKHNLIPNYEGNEISGVIELKNNPSLISIFKENLEEMSAIFSIMQIEQQKIIYPKKC